MVRVPLRLRPSNRTKNRFSPFNPSRLTGRGVFYFPCAREAEFLGELDLIRTRVGSECFQQA
jgi:hypothetical protein